MRSSEALAIVTRKLRRAALLTGLACAALALTGAIAVLSFSDSRCAVDGRADSGASIEQSPSLVPPGTRCSFTRAGSGTVTEVVPIGGLAWTFVPLSAAIGGGTILLGGVLIRTSRTRR